MRLPSSQNSLTHKWKDQNMNHHCCWNPTSHILTVVSSIRLNGSLVTVSNDIRRASSEPRISLSHLITDCLWAWRIPSLTPARYPSFCAFSQRVWCFDPYEQSGNYLCHMLTVIDTLRPTNMLYTVPKTSCCCIQVREEYPICVQSQNTTKHKTKFITLLHYNDMFRPKLSAIVRLYMKPIVCMP